MAKQTCTTPSNPPPHPLLHHAFPASLSPALTVASPSHSPPLQLLNDSAEKVSHSEHDPDPRNGRSGLWVKRRAAGGAGWLALSGGGMGRWLREGGEAVCEMAAVSTHICVLLCTPALLPWKQQLLEAGTLCVCVCGTVRARNVKNVHYIARAGALVRPSLEGVGLHRA